MLMLAHDYSRADPQLGEIGKRAVDLGNDVLIKRVIVGSNTQSLLSTLKNACFHNSPPFFRWRTPADVRGDPIHPDSDLPQRRQLRAPSCYRQYPFDTASPGHHDPGHTDSRWLRELQHSYEQCPIEVRLALVL